MIEIYMDKTQTASGIVCIQNGFEFNCQFSIVSAKWPWSVRLCLGGVISALMPL